MDDTCPYIMLTNDTQQPIIVYENDPVLIRYVTVDPDTNHTMLLFTRDASNSNDSSVQVLINSTGVYGVSSSNFNYFYLFYHH